MSQNPSSHHVLCQIGNIPGIGQAIPDREIGTFSFKQRIKLFLKRILPVETKRKLKLKADALLVNIGHAERAQPAPVSLPKEANTGIQPGEMVRIRSREEIAATLNSWGELKGCGFMDGMEQYCGTVQRVWKPVKRFVDERDYRVRKTRGIYILEGLICQGTEFYGPCDRSCFFFWREEWLEKVDKTGEIDAGNC